MTAKKHQFSLASETFADLTMEVLTHLPKPMPAAPSLERVLSEIGALPREALFLGIASDGLSVLLNLRDPIPGPVLILGDAGAGKTAFLRFVAGSACVTHTSTDVQYGVITNHPDEWNDVDATPHRIGLFPTHQTGTRDFLRSLASWAHTNKDHQASVLLLIDDLEEIAALDFEALQNLRWLLLRGPARRVWPILTLNAARYENVLTWIPGFRTRIFGRMENGRIAAALGADKSSAVESLEAQIQFSLRENGEWLRFWLPSR